MNTRKSLAKVFGPVLLLTAALALPVETMAAPPQARQAAADKADKNEKRNRNNRAKGQARAQQQKREDRARENRAAQGRRQAELKRQRNEQRQAARQQQVRQQRVERQQRKVEQQRIERQASRQREVQRQQRLESQRRLELRRQAELQRQAELRRQAQIRQQNAYRNNTRYRDNSRYRYSQPARRGRGGADPSIFHIDGYLTGGGGECRPLRDHDGRVWMLVGNTYGLQQGDHVRLYGRIVDGGQCGWQGTAFDIYEVRTVWADDRHRSTYYDHLYDGAFDRNSYDYNDDRYEDGYYEGGYDDDGYYEDGYVPYNNSENRRLTIKQGRLDFSRGCTFLRSGNQVFGLSGDLRGYREGDNVRVTGWQEGSRCGAPGLQVREITRD